MTQLNRSGFALIACVILPLALSGCGGSPTLYPVEGKVTVNGTPLKAGQVNLWPEDAKNTARPNGTIADGSYKVTTNGSAGAPAGKYKATITSAASAGESDPTKAAGTDPKGIKTLARPFDAKFEDAGKTTLVIEVVTSGTGNYELKLTK